MNKRRTNEEDKKDEKNLEMKIIVKSKRNKRGVEEGGGWAIK